MVDDLKKQMRRFENLIGFDGKLDVTSRKSVEDLINALSSKYKKDLQSSLRLHRLEFFYDLVENQRRKKEKREEDSITKLRTKHKSSSKKEKKEEEAKPADEEQQQQQLRDEEEGEPKISDEIMKIKAEDIDDWKDLMTLSRIYYVMEHPRSEGLTWKRRITKKKKIDQFEDMDLIEWRVSQNFRLRGLEEWAQRRSDAHLLAERLGFDLENTSESDEDSKEMDELFQMFDPSSRRKKYKNLEKKKPPSDRPFKFCDESIEDWTESYSEDSEYSDAENFSEEIECFSDDTDIKIPHHEDIESPTVFEEEDVSELFAVYPEFSKYKEPIFREMDNAKTFEEWLKLYKKAINQIEEAKIEEKLVKFEKKFDVISEEMEDENERDERVFMKEKEVREKGMEKQTPWENVEDTAKEKLKPTIDEKDQDTIFESESERDFNIEEKEKDTESKEKEREADTVINERDVDSDEKEKILDIEKKESVEDIEEEGKNLVFEQKERDMDSDESAIKSDVEKKESNMDSEDGESDFESDVKERKPDIREKLECTGFEEEGVTPDTEEKVSDPESKEKERDEVFEGIERDEVSEVKERDEDSEEKETDVESNDKEMKMDIEENECNMSTEMKGTDVDLDNKEIKLDTLENVTDMDLETKESNVESDVKQIKLDIEEKENDVQSNGKERKLDIEEEGEKENEES